MRFEVSRVLDTIEQHLTTDPLLAQAVFDVGEIARHPELDGGRGINLIRIGMVVDALGRYLRDGGVYLYPVAERKLLSDPELTSKERMVLGRWTDDGLIETTGNAVERVPEVADLTGLPIITLRDHADLARRYAFMADAPLRVLTLTPRGGGALLADGTGGTGGVLLRRRDEQQAQRSSFWRRVAVGKATPLGKVAPPVQASEPTAGAQPAGPADDGVAVVAAPSAESAADGPSAPPASAEQADPGPEAKPTADAKSAAIPRPPDLSVWPDPSRVYITLLPEPPAIRAAPSGVGGALLARLWHCGAFDCPSFGDERRIGQPVPRMSRGVPVCPRHDEPLKDAGPRPQEIAVALIVDGLRRRRFVVRHGHPVTVGREPDDEDDIAVGAWLHEAAASWISPKHLRLEVSGGQLVIADLSPNGSLVWMRGEPQARPDTLRLARGQTYVLGEWDTVELYTGIELGHGERRPKGVDASPHEPASVLADAPTVAMMRLADRQR